MTPCTLRPHPTQAHLAHLQRTGKGCVGLAPPLRSCRPAHPPCERRTWRLPLPTSAPLTTLTLPTHLRPLGLPCCSAPHTSCPNVRAPSPRLSASGRQPPAPGAPTLYTAQNQGLGEKKRKTQRPGLQARPTPLPAGLSPGSHLCPALGSLQGTQWDSGGPWGCQLFFFPPFMCG